MKQTKNEKILYRVKGNKFLFVVKNIWNVFWYAIGILLSIGFGTILLSGLSGVFRNDGQMNPVILNFGLLMIPLLILIRIIHIIFLRKNQFYIITEHGITSEGGFLTRFEQTLRMEEIQSVSFTQTLIQQILGCGNIVISSAATYRAGIILVNADHVKDIYHIINIKRTEAKKSLLRDGNRHQKQKIPLISFWLFPNLLWKQTPSDYVRLLFWL